MPSRGKIPVLSLIVKVGLRPAFCAALGLLPASGAYGSGDILRGGFTPPAASGATAPVGAPVVPSTVIKPNPSDMLARTAQALTAVQQMQAAARALAVSGPNQLLANLPVVPSNSLGQPNGLVVAVGVPSDLSNPGTGDNPSLWTGAGLPTATTSTVNGTTTQTVTIQQNQQQAVLNWQSFSVGKNTTLNFNQTAGGADAGQWIVFNKVGVTGSPTQILGSINAAGQVYVINPNGIIFGGSSQVNTHALVASSLPINDNLISLGLLNNPDTQFLFSALPIAAGANGTPAFTPLVSDHVVAPNSGGSQLSYVLSWTLRPGSNPTVAYTAAGAPPVALIAGTDYTVSTDQTGKATVTFSASAATLISGNLVNISYTPVGDQYGNVIVQAGAQLSAPTTPDHVGGRIALIGPNVFNDGTITTPDGQAILAAGLQVGIDAHPSTDPSLRGLDVFVGAVSDPTSTVPTNEGIVTNAAVANSDGSVSVGLIEAPRADVTMTGATVNQMGFVDSSTSVSYNGRIDLLAEYNSSANAAAFDNPQNSATTTPPFTPQSTGVVTMGPGSVTQILPEFASTDTIVGTQLALPSIVDIRGLAIHLASALDPANGKTVADSGAVLLAPSAGAAQDQNGNIISETNTRDFLTSGVTLDAGDWNILAQATRLQTQQFVNDAGQVYLDSGATIDVSGSADVSAPVSQDIVSVQLRGTELANSPLQQNGALRGQTVQVDLRQSGTFNGTAWVGTPLGDTSGYVSLVQRTVGELTTSGGTISVAAGNSFVLQPGATINVSGGWIDYQPGYVTTTQVISNGRVYSIANATPNLVYNGIYTGTVSTTDPKWNVTQSSTSPLTPGTTYDPGFVQGGEGGAISITSPAMALDGTLLGNTVAGPYQRTSAAQVNSTFANTAFLGTMQAVLAVPTASQLSLVFQGQDPSTAPLYLAFAPTPPNVVFKPAPASQVSVAPFSFDASDDPADLTISGIRGMRGAEVDLSPALMGADGFGTLTVDNSGGTPGTDALAPGGNIAVPASTVLTAAPGGKIVLKGANVDIEGSVSAPDGTLSFTAYDVSPLVPYGQLPPVDATRGTVTIGSGASLSVAGLVVNDGPMASAPMTLPIMTGGGSITINGFNADVLPGSVLNASGGIDALPSGKFTFGSGGKITIDAGRDPGLGSLDGGELTFDPGAGAGHVTLLGYSGPGSSGASLSIQAPMIQVGGSVLENGDETGADTLWLNKTDLNGQLLEPDFFSQGGFTSIALNGIGGAGTDSSGNATVLPAVYISAGTISPATGLLVPTVIAPQASNWVAQRNPADDGDFLLVAGSARLPIGQRTPVSLSFNAEGVTNSLLNSGTDNLIVRGDLILAEGASIVTDPQTSPGSGVSLSGNTVAVLGSVRAPGGTISITGSSQPTFLFGVLGEIEALPTVDIGPHSVLDVSGQTVYTQNSNGSLAGTVLAGGNVSVSGNIVAEKGAIINSSGASDASGLLNFPGSAINGGATSVGGMSGKMFEPAVVDSNGGSISFAGGQELYMDATLLGAAGGASAQAGSLSISSGRFYPTLNAASPTSSDVSLVVTGSGLTIPKTFTETGVAVIGSLVDTTDVDSSGNPIAETGHFAASSLTGSGEATLVLGGSVGAVEFLGSSSISVERSLSVAGGGVISVSPTTGDTKPVVTLDAPYVFLGTPFKLPSAQWSSSLSTGTMPSYGAGSLAVNAVNLIDIGDLSLQQVGAASFDAGAGDIRGNGTVDVSGVVSLTAGQIFPTTAGRFTLVAYDYIPPGGTDQPGTVNIVASSSQLPQMPLSAGGQLDIYASDINQGGVVRAPVGTINLGWNGPGPGPGTADAAHIDQNTGTNVPVTLALALSPGSVTSVSSADSTLSMIPYGVNLNGTAWIDPTGADITVAGVPGKSVSIEGSQVQVQANSKIDISGGGNLYAYQWISGTGGTNDILSPSYVANPSSPSSASFAVIPGYQPQFAPYAPYAQSTSNLGSDLGYVSNVNHPILVGDEVYIGAGTGLPAGFYTALPARYALLPGAYLVTPKAGTPPPQAVVQPDGSAIVGGYQQNVLNPGQQGPQSVLTEFEVALGTAPVSTTTPPPTVVRQRSQYADYGANSFLSASALSAGAAAPNLPLDGGQLVLSADQSMTLKGSVASVASTGGTGGMVDISSAQDITIGSRAPAGDLLLNPAELSSFGAQSLLIGGTREVTSTGTQVAVTAGNISVDNAGSPLTGTDVILAANTSITLGAGSAIEQQGTMASSAGTLLFSGNGAVVRVSSDPAATVTWTGVTTGSSPTMTVGANARVLGSSVTLESTANTLLDPSATLGGVASAVTLGSGQISIQLPGSGALRTQANGLPTSGLVLTGNVLDGLESTAGALSLVSYSSIDIYGDGTLGSPLLSSLTLHTPEIHGDGGSATLAAGKISIDNSSNSAAPDAFALAPGTTLGGTLVLAAGTIGLGSHPSNIQGYADVNLNATGSVLAQGAAPGSLATQGNLTVTTPTVAATTLSTSTSTPINETITAAGNLALNAPSGGPSAAGGTGLGASLTFVGATVAVDTEVSLPSGSLLLHANGTDVTSGVTLGDSAVLDVGGTSKVFQDQKEYSSAGQVTLASDSGSVTVGDGSILRLAAQQGGGNGGSLSVDAPNGLFSISKGTILGAGGLGGQNGSFSLDVSAVPGPVMGTSDLASLGGILSTGGFTQAVSVRVRTGDVNVDGTLKAQDVSLSADAGSITVAPTGVIDASGRTGGDISLSASGSVSLQSGSQLTVKAVDFNDAGKGGAVSLDAGSSTGGAVTSHELGMGPQLSILSGSTIDLSVVNNLPLLLNASGTSSLTVPSGTPFTFPTGTPGNDEITFSAGGTLTSATGVATAFRAGFTTAVAPGSSVVFAGASASKGTVSFASGGTGGSVPVNIPAGISYTPTNVSDLTAFDSTGTLNLRAPQAMDSNGNPVDVQIARIDGTIVAPSSIVAEGFAVFTPIGGVIDTVEAAVKDNGAAFAGGIDSTGTVQMGNSAAIEARLLASNPGLMPMFHVQPGAEIVNAADASQSTAVTLNSGSSSISLPSGAVIQFPSGGSELSFSSGGVISGADGTITAPDGTTTPFTAASSASFLPGSTVTLSDAGSVTLSASGKLTIAGGTGTVPVRIPAAASYSLGGANSSILNSQGGTILTLSTSGASGSSASFAAGEPIAFPSGTPGTDKIKSNQAGFVVSPNGTETAFNANASNITVPTGGYIVLKTSGVLTFASGSTPVTLALANGTYTTSVTGNPTPILLGTQGSFLSLPAGTPIQFAGGGAQMSFSAAGAVASGAGTITTPGGTTTPFASGSNPSFPAGSILTFSSAGSVTLTTGGNLTLTGGSGGIPLTLPTGTTYAVGGFNGTSLSSADGVVLDLPSLGSSANFAAGVAVAFPGGTPAADTLSSTQSGYVVAPGGMKTPFAALASDIIVPQGGYVVLNAPGTLALASGSAPIAMALSEGTYSTKNIVGATTVTLGNLGSSLSLPGGTSVQIPGAGSQLSFSSAGVVTGGSGVITAPGGLPTPFASGSNPTYPAGSTVTFTTPGSVSLTSAGSLALAGAGLNVPISIPAGILYAVGGASGTTLAAASGEVLSLTTSGPFGSSAAFGAGVPVAFPIGTPGTDKVRSDQSGIIVAPGGTTTAFAANSSNLVVPAGGYVVLDAPGTLSFVSGTVPVQLALSQGTYSTSGATSLAATPGNLTLASSWDLSTYRFGPNSIPATPMDVVPPGAGEPGILTLRAAGNLAFNSSGGTALGSSASLSDGFDPSNAALSQSASVALWTAPLLPVGSRSWSYSIVAGADLGAADVRTVMSLSGPASLPAGVGSVLIGSGAIAIPTAVSATTSENVVPSYYQAIRTGTGDIGIYASADVQLLNPLASVYTAGTQAPPLDGFTVPLLNGEVNPLAPVGQSPYYPAQYSYGGGDVAVVAQRDVAHYIQTSSGLVMDSSKEIPDNWLYRRGSLNAAGQFDTLTNLFDSNGDSVVDVTSTSWWTDFSNFFEGVGALGGGNVRITAGNNVANVDAVVPSNLRAVGVDSNGIALTPAAATTLELGGGDLEVQAGANINGGIYYVERGQGTLSAGNSIVTNATRAALTQSQLQPLARLGAVPDPTTWLPTTLFLGQGAFDVTSNGNLLLGPVANPFLLPQGVDNGYYYKSYFSTYSLTDSVSASSLNGSITLADNADGGGGSLANWTKNLFTQGNASAAKFFLTFSQPWLTVIETSPAAFTQMESIMPPTLNALSFGGDINLVGNLILSPAPTGELNLLAAGSINGIQPNSPQTPGSAYNAKTNPYLWEASIVDVSDADPARVPGVASPLGLSTLTDNVQAQTQTTVLAQVGSLFAESGATSGLNVVLQTQELLHGPSPTSGGAEEPLHFGDTNPLHFFALNGDISGLTMYSPKSAQVGAGNDITDVALYIQNVQASDLTLVSAGRDIIAFDPNSALRLEAQTLGNKLAPFNPASVSPGSSAPNAGDIQISGPGTLEVLAGRTLNLGTGSPVTTNGLADGITSIGNARNPLLPFAGANIVVGAGLGAGGNLSSGQLDFTDPSESGFVDQFLNPTTAGAEATRYLPDLGALMGTMGTNQQVWAAFSSLPTEQQDLLALDVFYLVLRDAGRDRNNPMSPAFGNYDAGSQAIAALFGKGLDYTNNSGTGFVDQFLNPASGGAQAAQYLPELGTLMGTMGSNQQIFAAYQALDAGEQHALALKVFASVLSDAANRASVPSTATAGNALLTQALGTLFSGEAWSGNILIPSHEIRTSNGGDIAVLAPGGQITVGYSTDKQTPDQGILTEQGGNISVFAQGDVSLGTSRVFTLSGGNVIIWSMAGNIAAGSGSKTVHSAPPTRVLINPQSADVQNDLAGLATGSGIGVLATLTGVAAGDVDLIAPVGTVDAGDAGIRASGNLNIAARVVLNASNIQAGGTSAGLPPPAAPPNIAGLAAASSAAASADSTASEIANKNTATTPVAEIPSVISVEVLGYGGDDDSPDPGDTQNSPQ